ncbi:glycoside hydrolase/phage tail family protein [Sulfitobacter albidus]|uniref:Glycoside hydrolase/phage tail family protein n=1 Tax=Sulfitobacter albidus TaxID=2829501 RepID=A0A975JFB8_9RHOB|nr:glycoside hydrolase TIM-barrel-like domain-containing protein [Sulfitobacter albidus]QUJ77413.1 glycoside hydrolase/phage tail family protein [Sulfitobacter albidus]
MATILFSAAGAAIGGSVGGTLAGLSSVAIGRAVGATLGRVVDQKILGTGAQAVETGKVDRFRLSSAGEGDPIPQLFGRMRVGGQVIWASDFEETASVSGGGKGRPSRPKTTEYSYSVNLAIALGTGEISRVGRIWADGEEIAPDDLNLTVYTGSAHQQPDPLMEAIEGPGQVPAYRGTAYVVIEALGLQAFGNRVPQFSFEVVRPEQSGAPGASHALPYGVQGVALIPGTGEYSLATTPVSYEGPDEARWSANINSPSGKPDFTTSFEALTDEVPALRSASLVVSWFGSDLRMEHCDLRPKVEDPDIDGEEMPWIVSGLRRDEAQVIAKGADDRPIYGGTPADQAVIEAIRAMRTAGKEVMFYPFILMDQDESNELPNPYTGQTGQPALPWRGRITLDAAPGQEGSSDGTVAATAQVGAFFGTVTAADFTVLDGEVSYTGPDEWSLTRFILHYAALCAAAGGVEAFCISSEMRGLTQVRSSRDSFPAVDALRALAAEARSLLGAQTKISYAADWSEYFGYTPQDGTGDVFFHLDPLWADPQIDFIGVDNYMPLSDWREGIDHLDAQSFETIYDMAYLQSNIEGGEGYDWFYGSQEERDFQRRTPITDGAYDEPWTFRYKDFRGWWENLHFNRIDGVKVNDPTGWLPGLKPFWFTEYGCAAIDKGTNQPNKFLDPKSSESSLPRYSDGARDDLIQMQYLRAMIDYWAQPENNPQGIEYDGPMIDMRRAFVWAWDVRPYPFFPGNRDLWSDGANYARGHWLNGRTSNRSLASVVGEICRRSGVLAFDTSGLYGIVRGYGISAVSEARSALQPLMIRFGFDAIERDGVLCFRMRDGLRATDLDPTGFAVSRALDGTLVQGREAEAELSGRVRVRFIQADGNFEVISEEAVLNDARTHAVSSTEFSMTLTRAEGRQVAERFLNEARIARETVQFALPPSRMAVRAGDVVSLPGDQAEGAALYRVDRVDQAEFQQIEAVRIDPELYDPAPLSEEAASIQAFVAPVPVSSLFMDLPLIRGDEIPYAPYIAASANPWPGSVALYSSPTGANFALDTLLPIRATVGTTRTALLRAHPGRIDRGAALEVKLVSGRLESVSRPALLSGANLAAVGDGSPGNWELIQFQDVELIAQNTYLLRTRLRGQAGSDGLMPDVWPEGSKFVLLNGVPQQIALERNLRGVAQTYRIGPARRPIEDNSFRELVRAFDGNGLRPYAPAHLRASGADDLDISWIRRTRVDGDPWEAPEVPLGEESESYLMRVRKDGAVLREEILSAPAFSYSASAQAGDGAVAPFDIEVAQISSTYGPGMAARITVGA